MQIVMSIYKSTSIFAYVISILILSRKRNSMQKDKNDNKGNMNDEMESVMN